MDELYFSRLTNLITRFSDKSLDAFIVSVPENRYYLSGFYAEDGGPQETAGYLVIGENKRYLVTDGRYEIQAKNEAPLYEVVIYEKDIGAEVAEILENLGCQNVGFEAHYLTYGAYTKILEAIKKTRCGCKLSPEEDFVENLRMIKDAAEISLIENAVFRTEKVLAQVVPELKDGVTEKDIACLLELGLKKAGAEKLAFDPIVASGPNGALPHAKPTNRAFKTGDAVVIDFGGRFDHYCSDMTRTFFIGSVPEEVRELYDTVRKAQKLAVESVKPGKMGKEIDRVARNFISTRGFGEYFVHGLGHGVGLAVHEKPGINKRSETKLEPGMVITIEPGIYVRDVGGVRLEDMVLVTDDGCKVLNSGDFYYDAQSQCFDIGKGTQG